MARLDTDTSKDGFNSDWSVGIDWIAYHANSKQIILVLPKRKTMLTLVEARELRRKLDLLISKAEKDING